MLRTSLGDGQIDTEEIESAIPTVERVFARQ